MFGRLFSTSRRRPAQPSTRRKSPPRLEQLEDRLTPSTYTVINLGDAGAGNNNQGDLRYCITQADKSMDTQNQIFFGNGLQGTITLNSALPDISKNIGIVGPGASTITVTRTQAQGSGSFRIFTVDSDVTSGSIQALTIDGGILTSGNGGGVYNSGYLTLYNDVIQDNKSTDTNSLGGGVYNAAGATLIMNGTSVGFNEASSGGGIANLGSVTINGGNSIYSNEAFQGDGGGIYNGTNATMTVSNSSNITGNTASNNGGGVMNNGTFTMHGGQISNNDAGSSGNGGGLYNSDVGNATLDQGVTISKNGADNGGGLYLQNGSSTTLNTVTIQNNLLFGGGNGKGIYQDTTGAKLNQTNVTDPDGLYTA